jgi:hypothetical protein
MALNRALEALRRISLKELIAWLLVLVAAARVLLDLWGWLGG